MKGIPGRVVFKCEESGTVRRITFNLVDGRTVEVEGKFDVYIDGGKKGKFIPFKSLSFSPVEDAMQLAISDEVIVEKKRGKL